jgi:AbrB family looped-hinge helix DNA binding protein
VGKSFPESRIVTMVTVLHEIKRDNVVWFYLRDQFYEQKVVKETHLRPATLGDVTHVLRPSLVSTRRTLQIVGAWAGLGNLTMISSDVDQARRDEYYSNILYGMLFSAGFAALHARINRIGSEDVLNELYLDALRSTVCNFNIEGMRAFGLPLRDEPVKEALTVRIDAKGRMTIPKYVRMSLGWRPGDSLQLQLDPKKEELTFCLVKAKQVPRMPIQTCERFFEIPEGFFHVCVQSNPLRPDELEKAINENMSMLSTLLEDMPNVPNLFRKILTGRKNARTRPT